MEILVAVLALLNLAQFAFWGYLVNRLINKLMSRSYAEYKRAESVEKKPTSPKEKDEGIGPADLDEIIEGIIR